MAEIQGKAEIIPSGGLAGPTVQGDMGRYSIKVSEYSPSGMKEQFAVALPDDVKWGNIMLRAALLKRTTWKTFEIPMILHAVVYADQMGLDIMAGDVYMAQEGRLSTTAGAKIRHAMGTGKIAGYSVDITEGPLKKFNYKVAGKDDSIELPNYKAKVTVEVVGWKNPVVYETKLDEWFVGFNPNWRTRPTYMLRRNALSKALEEVAPMGVEADEAPPVTQAEQYASENMVSIPRMLKQVQMGAGMGQTFLGGGAKGLLGGDNE